MLSYPFTWDHCNHAASKLLLSDLNIAFARYKNEPHGEMTHALSQWSSVVKQVLQKIIYPKSAEGHFTKEFNEQLGNLT